MTGKAEIVVEIDALGHEDWGPQTELWLDRKAEAGENSSCSLDNRETKFVFSCKPCNEGRGLDWLCGEQGSPSPQLS